MFTKRYTTGEFIEKANIIHEFKFDYSLVEYIRNDIKVKIICKDHGIFEQTPTSHLKGTGCKRCYFKRNSDTKSSNTKEFIDKSINIYGNDIFNYKKVNYKHSKENVILICIKHNFEFLQRPNDHLKKHYWGCEFCQKENKKVVNHSQEYIEQYFKNHGCELLDNYINANVKVKYRCSCGNISYIKFGNFQQGARCKICGLKKRSKNTSKEKHHNWNPNRDQIKLNNKVIILSHSLLNNVLKYTGKKKNNKTENILGYTRKELLEHLQKDLNFNNWKNTKNEYHIDHLFPIIGFIEYNIFDPKIINSLDNLRIIPAKENLIKHDKYDKQKFKIYLKNKGLIGENNE